MACMPRMTRMTRPRKRPTPKEAIGMLRPPGRDGRLLYGCARSGRGGGWLVVRHTITTTILLLLFVLLLFLLLLVVLVVLGRRRRPRPRPQVIGVLRRLFARLDADRDGAISRADLRAEVGRSRGGGT